MLISCLDTEAYATREARDLHLVLGSAANGKPVRFKAAGRRQAANGKDRLFEIEFLDAGAQAYAFTFG